MEDGDTEKYRAQDFVFLSRKGGGVVSGAFLCRYIIKSNIKLI